MTVHGDLRTIYANLDGSSLDGRIALLDTLSPLDIHTAIGHLLGNSKTWTERHTNDAVKAVLHGCMRGIENGNDIYSIYRSIDSTLKSLSALKKELNDDQCEEIRNLAVVHCLKKIEVMDDYQTINHLVDLTRKGLALIGQVIPDDLRSAMADAVIKRGIEAIEKADGKYLANQSLVEMNNTLSLLGEDIPAVGLDRIDLALMDAYLREMKIVRKSVEAYLGNKQPDPLTNSPRQENINTIFDAHAEIMGERVSTATLRQIWFKNALRRAGVSEADSAILGISFVAREARAAIRNPLLI